MEVIKEKPVQFIVSVPVSQDQLDWINEQAERNREPGYTRPNRSVVLRRLIELEMKREKEGR